MAADGPNRAGFPWSAICLCVTGLRPCAEKAEAREFLDTTEENSPFSSTSVRFGRCPSRRKISV
jgi:hypothetical protein